MFSTVFIGVSAPQGCGKTTLTEYLQVNIYICFLASNLTNIFGRYIKLVGCYYNNMYDIEYVST